MQKYAYAHVKILVPRPFFSKATLIRRFLFILQSFVKNWEVSPFREAVLAPQQHPCAIVWSSMMKLLCPLVELMPSGPRQIVLPAISIHG